MFLFNKRTRNIIKYMWGFFATLIILTMIIAYSGFASLAQQQPEQIEIPEEVRQQLQLQREGGANFEGDEPTATEQELLRAIEAGEIDINPEDSSDDTQTTEETDTEGEAPQQSSEEFKLEI